MEVFAILRSAAGYMELHKPIIVVGRSADCDIALDSRSLSGHHAKIILEGPENSALIDLNSRHGTYINGIRVRNESVPIHHGDTISFGADIPAFQIEFLGAGTAAPDSQPKMPPQPLNAPPLNPIQPIDQTESPTSKPSAKERTAAHKNTWFSDDNVPTDDFPVLSIAQQEYRAAARATVRSQNLEESLSELTIPSQRATLEPLSSYASQSINMQAFLRQVLDNLVTCSTKEAYCRLVAACLGTAGSVQPPERDLLVSILEHLEKALSIQTCDASAGTDPLPELALPAPPESARDSVELLLSTYCQLHPEVMDPVVEISSLRQAIADKNEYERHLLERLDNYKTAVSLLKDDLLNYLTTLSASQNVNDSLAASIVDAKLREHQFSEELRRRQEGGKASADLSDIIEIQNKQIQSLIQENAALQSRLNQQLVAPLGQAPHVFEAEIIRVLLGKLQSSSSSDASV